MKIIKILFIFFITLFVSPVLCDEQSFDNWLIDFKKYALENKISENTFDKAMSHVVFLPKVIKYDRFQPEFYEDTRTYISKRTTKQKVKNGTGKIGEYNNKKKRGC